MTHQRDPGAAPAPADRHWWNTPEHCSTPLQDLIPGYTAIVDRPIPYALLPRRARTVYGSAMQKWCDLGKHTPQSLLTWKLSGPTTVNAIITAATAAAATETTPPPETARAAADRLISELNDRDVTILSQRSWAQTPTPHAELASHLGVQPISIRRYQRRAQARLEELLTQPAHHTLVGQAAALRATLGPYTPHAAVTAELHRLDIPANDIAADLLLHLAGPYRRHHDWYNNTTVDGSAAASAAITTAFATDPAPPRETLLAALTGIGMPPQTADAYLETHLTLRDFGDRCVPWNTDTTANMIEAALQAHKTPATPAEVTDLIDIPEVRLTTVAAVLSDDHRFSRASRTTWALRTWELPEYVNVDHAITTCLDAAGGAATQADLITAIRSTFPDVAATSIQTHLSTLNFIRRRDGLIRRRKPRDPWPEFPHLRTARGAFHDPHHQARLLLPVTADLLRGSGRPLPPAFAAAIGIRPGQRKHFTSAHGQTAVTWRLASTNGATLGSIRALLRATGATPDDRVVLAFGLTEPTINAARLPPSTPAHLLWQHVLGRPIDDLPAALATALDCPTHQTEATLRARGDHALADLLHQS